MCSTVQDIRKSFASLRIEKKLGHQELAQFLEITEAELVDAHVGISKLDVIKSVPQLARAIRLKKPWSSLIPMIQRLGDVMSSARNKSTVHELKGSYKNAYLENETYKIVSDHFQLQLKYLRCEFAYLFEECQEDAVQRSIQFFDECGQAMYKIFLLPDSHHWYFDEIAKRHGDTHQEPGILIHDQMIEEISVQSSQINRFNELKQLGCECAKPIDTEALCFILESAAHLKLPLKISLTNLAVHQTYQGPVHEWSNVNSWGHLIHQDFKLNLDLRKIPLIWLVHHLHRENMKTSIELCNQNGTMALVIGHADYAELNQVENWQNLIKQGSAGEFSSLAAELES